MNTLKKILASVANIKQSLFVIWTYVGSHSDEKIPPLDTNYFKLKILFKMIKCTV
jgi:hypothetical protein